MKNDITTVINGGITGANISPTASIPESSIDFDPVAGHDHDGVGSHVVAGGSTLRADITGMMPRIVAGDTARAESGAMELNSVVYTRNAYSSTRDLDTNGHWVEGAAPATISVTFYMYAYNDAGTTWDVKFWMQAPQYANCGTDTDGTLIFRQSGGVWYRCIGVGTTDGAGDIVSILSWGGSGGGSSSTCYTTIFNQFSGNGEDDAPDLSAGGNFSDFDGAITGIAQYTSFNLPAGQTLTINTVYAYIAVQGDCHIHGTINADALSSSVNGSSKSYGLSGGGGSGSVAGYWNGGTGGYHYGTSSSGEDAGGAGGAGQSEGGTSGETDAWHFKNGAAGSATSANNIAKWSSVLSNAINSGGGGAGTAGNIAGGGAGNGGSGGGIIYIEVGGNLVFDGTISADGSAGTASSYCGGGGGGGGTIIIRVAGTATTAGSTMTVTGGGGGAGSNSTGGAGAAGYSEIVEL